MTSPAQLKYLDAIGIPVWVSRDLVQGRALSNAPLQEDIPNDLQSSQQRNITSNSSGVTHGHVDSLLHDLDAKPQKPHSEPSVAQNILTPKTSAQKATHPIAEVINPTHKQATEIGRTTLHTIYACGDMNAEWMVIGEAPDISSNGQGQPYAGEVGILLNNMLRAIGFAEPRKQTYLINILKTASQKSVDIEKTEKETLNHLLVERIQQIKPKVLLIVGQIAAQNLLKTKEPLVRLRGKKHSLGDTHIPLVVTYYPSYLLSKPLDKRKAWEDLKLAMSC